MLRIAMVAGEASGDYLGGGLIRALQERCGSENVRVEGVAGPHMRAAGCEPVFDVHQLSLMGFAEVVWHLPRILRMRRALVSRFTASPPDVFIGIDAPDFNLSLERVLRDAGIPVVHYVSPTVWAWRSGRMRHIARAVDHMLTLFPFEETVYREAGVPVTCVGHPLADAIPLEPPARPTQDQQEVLAVLPGSRASELRYLGDAFAQTISWLHARRPQMRFVAPMANVQVRQTFADALQRHAPQVDVTLVDGRSHEVMADADAVLLACGTAALEAMLLRRPMVAAYRLNRWTHLLLRILRLVRVRWYSLPNLLAQACPPPQGSGTVWQHEVPVPEFIQDQVQPAAMGTAILEILENNRRREHLMAEFARLHHLLRRDASATAADEVLRLVGRRA